MTTIIAFAGRKQSGKTTCSEALRNILLPQKKQVKIYNFADPLKQDICMNILGLTHQQCYGNDHDKNTLTDLVWENRQLTAREVMQFVGTDIFRKMKQNVWADATITKIQQDQPDIALIADCRFPNEVKAVHENGGMVIKLTRNPFNSDHDSEKALDVENYDQNIFDFIINNQFCSIQEQVQMMTGFLVLKGIISSSLELHH